MWKAISIVSISFLLQGPVRAQSIESTKRFGIEQARKGQYNSAFKALNRVAFFLRQDPDPTVLYYLAESAFHLGRTDLAEAYYDRCYFIADDSLSEQALLGKIRALIRLRHFKEAQLEIFSAPANLEASAADRLHFYAGLSYYALENYQEAARSFKSALPTEDSLGRAQIDALLIEDRRNLIHPKPKLAGQLSYFLPGLGQFYAGDIKNGVNSLALTTGALALAVNVMINYSVLDGIIAVIPWTQRFYLGGSTRASLLADQRRQEKRQARLLEIMALFPGAS